MQAFFILWRRSCNRSQIPRRILDHLQSGQRSTYSTRCSLDRCAYFRTISTHSQPPSSCNTCSGVPACTCQLAQVCRRSCQRKFIDADPFQGFPPRLRVDLRNRFAPVAEYVRFSACRSVHAERSQQQHSTAQQSLLVLVGCLLSSAHVIPPFSIGRSFLCLCSSKIRSRSNRSNISDVPAWMPVRKGRKSLSNALRLMPR